jgi:NAD(P)-dependent dehydrogenase (short-subunit alcohol dehydrogenase family)
MTTKTGRLAGKVAIVAGAGSSGPGVGSGKATATLFAREGAKLVLLDLHPDRAEETKGMVEAEGSEAIIIGADITSGADCERVVVEAVDRFGAVDVLVNNVGVHLHGGVVSVTEDDWDFQLRTNLKGMMLLTKYSVPRMIDAGGGAIINIASTGAVRPNGGHVAYDSAKGGVIAFTVGVAVEHGRDGIRCNCIMPGRMVTPMVSGPDPAAQEQFVLRNRRLNLLGAEGTAWDIGHAAVFLSSEDARWITAVTLPVDGGFLHTPPDYERFWLNDASPAATA